MPARRHVMMRLFRGQSRVVTGEWQPAYCRCLGDIPECVRVNFPGAEEPVKRWQGSLSRWWCISDERKTKNRDSGKVIAGAYAALIFLMLS